MQELNKALGITTKLLTSFHPQTDKQTEIVNKEIGKFLQIYCFEKQDSWFAWLPITQFSINTKKHAATKKSPFDVTRSHLPQMEIEPISSYRAPVAQKFTSDMEDIIESIKENMKQAQDRIKVNADESRLAAPEYTIGQQVWLSTENLRLTRASCKLSERWLGPYTIISLAGPNAVELKLPKSMQIHPVVNVSRVKPYRDRLEGQPTHQLGPINVTEDRDNEWEVDRIIDSRYKNKKLEFLVHWKGYDDMDHTWEPRSNLRNAKEALTDFYHANLSASRAISIPPEDFLLLFQRRPEPFTTLHPKQIPVDCVEVNL